MAATAERAPVRGDRDFQPGERVRVAAAGYATHGRLGTVVDPDDTWPFGPCVLLDGDGEPGAFESAELERVAPDTSDRAVRPPSRTDSSADERLARTIAALILEERTRTEAVWRARLDAVRREMAPTEVAGRDAATAEPALDRDALVAVLACAEEYVSGAPLNRALVLHALRAALVRLGARPGAEPLPGAEAPAERRPVRS